MDVRNNKTSKTASGDVGSLSSNTGNARGVDGDVHKGTESHGNLEAAGAEGISQFRIEELIPSSLMEGGGFEDDVEMRLSRNLVYIELKLS